MRVTTIALLLTATACHNSGTTADGPAQLVVDANQVNQVDGAQVSVDAPLSNGSDANVAADASASIVDAMPNSNPDANGALAIDARTGAPDASSNSSPDAHPSMFPIGQAGDSDCWSDGGFGYVRPDAPGYVVATLYDQDGVDDIVMTADMVIYGASNYAVGTSPLISLGQTGCCTITVKAAGTYDDLIETANAVGGPPDGEFWGGQATFHDSAGNATTATCSGSQTEWHAESNSGN